jgi:hypothetical protein
MFSQIFYGNKALDWITSLLNNKKQKNYILDPMTCIIRLSILSFKNKGTKISISDNQISYHEPTLIQGPIRWTNGDNREDLHNLYYPILKSTQWYSKNKDLSIIYRHCISGLENLMNSYSKNSTIGHSLKHYIDIIKKFLDSDIQENHQDNHNLTDQTKQIYQELKSLWSSQELSIVKKLLEQISKNYENDSELETNHYISSLEQILLMKELKVNNMLLHSYSILD